MITNTSNASEFAGILVHGQTLGVNDSVLYQVPVGSHCWVHMITVCNTTGGNRTFSLAFCERGVVDHPSDWLFNDFAITSKDAFQLVLDVRLDPQDSIVCHSDTGGIALTVFGSLI